MLEDTLPPLYNGWDEETCGLEFLPCSNLLIVSSITMHMGTTLITTAKNSYITCL